MSALVLIQFTIAAAIAGLVAQVAAALIIAMLPGKSVCPYSMRAYRDSKDAVDIAREAVVLARQADKTAELAHDRITNAAAPKPSARKAAKADPAPSFELVPQPPAPHREMLDPEALAAGVQP